MNNNNNQNIINTEQQTNVTNNPVNNPINNEMQNVSANINNSNTNQKKNIFSKNTIIVILIVLVVLVGLLIVPKSKSKKLKLDNSNIKIGTNDNQNLEFKNNNLLTTNDIEINAESIIPTEYNYQVQFSLNNKSNNQYNFLINKLKVNDIDMFFGTKTGSNFRPANIYVEPNQKSYNYVMLIWYDELEKKNIKKDEIKKLSFQLLIYKGPGADNSNRGQQLINDYKNVELK